MLIVPKSEQPVQTLEGRTLQWLANSATGTTMTALLENVIAPGGGVPPHHHTIEELLVCIEGQGEVVVGGVSYPFGAGDTAIVPAQVVHGVRNAGQSPFRMLGFFASAQPIAVSTNGQPLLQADT